jgi:hypothetical protein
MAQWQDLSEEDRVKVIGGLVLVASMLTFSLIFFQVFSRGSLPFGTSPFSGMRMLLLTMYIVIVIPSVLLTVGAVVYLRRRFSEMLGALIILLMAGGYFLFAGFFLTLFDVFLSGLPIEVAIILVALALFVPAVVITQIMIAKKNSKYLKWAFK